MRLTVNKQTVMNKDVTICITKLKVVKIVNSKLKTAKQVVGKLSPM